MGKEDKKDWSIEKLVMLFNQKEERRKQDKREISEWNYGHSLWGSIKTQRKEEKEIYELTHDEATSETLRLDQEAKNSEESEVGGRWYKKKSVRRRFEA